MRFQHQPKLTGLTDAIKSSVHGYASQIETLICCLISGGHVSALGDPGTGKTLTMKCLAHAIGDGNYQRIQMVPDMMPADILGTEVLDRDSSSFRFVHGPLNPTVNLLLADEINRTPPRTQSALLESMEEGQISVSGYSAHTYRLHEVFMLMATQNPIESDGVYPLPEAQLDRFAVQLLYPKLDRATERLVLSRTAFKRHTLSDALSNVLTLSDIISIREEIEASIHCSDSALEYAHNLCYATHRDQCPETLKGVFRTGVSVRAAQWALRLARVHAYLVGREYITADDIKFVIPSVLRHRLYMSEEMEMKGWSPDRAIAEILKAIPISTGD
ncbi:MAG: AAA family ATPase [Candidatus Obscuribacterales bacterium]|nr:AAA family ATPase [Candidatus Obscuribacterales bacterium]